MHERPFSIITGYSTGGALTTLGLAEILGLLQTGLGIVSFILGIAIGWVTLQNQLHIRRQQKQAETS